MNIRLTGIFLVLFYIDNGLSLSLDSSGLIEGDIIPPKNRNGILFSKRWTNGIIPWEFSKGPAWGPKHTEMLSNVMRTIETHTCLRFVPRSNQVNYVKITNQTGHCSSSLGQAGGMQELNLPDSEITGGCWSGEGGQLLFHEILHAVGLGHEHTRYDREKYIKIYLNNVEKTLRSNFEIGFQNETNTYGVPYDYYSIMHYGKKSHTKNGRVTMKPTDINMINVIGMQKTASENDFEKVRRIYECKGSYPKVPQPPPGKPPTQADLHICEDEYDFCEQQLDKCGKEDWTKTWCKRSCGFCTKEDDCQDDLDYCAQLEKQGYCSYQMTREVQCKKTCKFC